MIVWSALTEDTVRMCKCMYRRQRSSVGSTIQHAADSRIEVSFQSWTGSSVCAEQMTGSVGVQC